jgi:hypothetical protein
MSLAELSPGSAHVPETESVEGGTAELGSVLGLHVVECEADDQLAVVPVEPLTPEAAVTHSYPPGQSHAAFPTGTN